MPSSTQPHQSWDIFCRVVDNYGDIGVCWRLARQLASEYGVEVRLWVDELEALAQIWPDAQVIEHQYVAGVEVRHWAEDFSSVTPAQVVIEAFACEIPANYLAAMALQKQSGAAPAWLNLEYLSAETWVEDCHKMESIHPSTGLRKTFFFPGFSQGTGGLLRESGLVERCEHFQSQLKHAWLASQGISLDPQALLISLFAYENPAVGSLLSALAASARPVHCLVPTGRLLTSINQAIGQTLDTGDSYRQGQLCLQVVPFTTQFDYDHLLWACDINFVRGEDSFVRAQWAGKPLVWHIYPQDEDAHITKLDAFLTRYTQGMAPSLANGINNLWHSWNRDADTSLAWLESNQLLEGWIDHSRQWRQYLLAQDSLAAQLVAFCTAKNTTENR
jgi:uncharacterized repeat protein (TIGR03837 family)